MALVELGQGTLVQVLFPYLLNPKGQTTFEAWEQMNTLQETTKHQEVIEGESVLYTLDNPSTATRRSPPHV